MEIRKIAILGAGRLGRGVAECAAAKGYDIILFAQGAGGQDALGRIEKSLDRKLAKWAITESEKRLILGRISLTQDLKELSQVDLLIEAVPGEFSGKQELLQAADRLCRPEVIFISTDPIGPVANLAGGISRNELLVGLHFIPPVPDVPVVELTSTPSTAEKTLQVAKHFAHRLDKQVLHIQQSPGLVNPRSLLVLINEAAFMLDEGMGTAAAVEAIIKKSWGMKQGPLEMADRLGLDLILSWMEEMRRVLGDRYAPCPLIKRYVRLGRLGVKTKVGFLNYSADDALIQTTERELEDA